MGKILARGHSRVPVYTGNPRNIIGLLLVGEKTRWRTCARIYNCKAYIYLLISMVF